MDKLGIACDRARASSGRPRPTLFLSVRLNPGGIYSKKMVAARTETAESPQTDLELKHLNFVVSASEVLSSAALKGYTAVKNYAPQTVETIEVKSAPFVERYQPVLAPLATKAIDASLQSLKAADAKVSRY